MWPTSLMVLGVISGPLVFFTVGERTFITYTALVRWFLFFALLGSLMPARWYAGKLKMDRKEWLLFSLLAVAPLLLSAGLLINRAFHGPEEWIMVEQGREIDPVKYWREHGEMPPNKPWAGIPWPSDMSQIQLEHLRSLSSLPPDAALFASANGLFGYRVETGGRQFIVMEGQWPITEE